MKMKSDKLHPAVSHKDFVVDDTRKSLFVTRDVDRDVFNVGDLIWVRYDSGFPSVGDARRRAFIVGFRPPLDSEIEQDPTLPSTASVAVCIGMFPWEFLSEPPIVNDALREAGLA